MPYVKKERQEAIARGSDAGPVLILNELKSPGDLNFAISILMKMYYINAPEKNYQLINDIIGAAEGAKTEFYRRVAVPYEDQKMEENGDIYYGKKAEPAPAQPEPVPAPPAPAPTPLPTKKAKKKRS